MSDDLNREYAETDITEEEAESRRAVLENGEAAVTVEQLRLAVTAFRDVRNWRQFHNPKDLAVAMAVEAAEVLELCRFKTDEEIAAAVKAGDHSFADEMADVLSYLLSLADVLNIDLPKALAAKMKINAEHYPVKLAKGRAAKYTELQRNRD
ncbi:nucleotide pyrophosphohydrolase [bacterium]|nr:nucleotide pyrophosphohydrolase [bacterium]